MYIASYVKYMYLGFLNGKKCTIIEDKNCIARENIMLMQAINSISVFFLFIAMQLN